MTDVERVEFDTMPREPALSMWREWMRSHGVNPNDVAVPGWIERHPDTYRLVYESYDFDEQGRIKIDRERDDAVRVARAFQMEAPPLQWPVPDDTAGCDCGHLVTSHEPDDYDAVGTPVRPICTVEPCPCGSEWKD